MQEISIHVLPLKLTWTSCLPKYSNKNNKKTISNNKCMLSIYYQNRTNQVEYFFFIFTKEICFCNNDLWRLVQHSVRYLYWQFPLQIRIVRLKYGQHPTRLFCIVTPYSVKSSHSIFHVPITFGFNK